MAAYPTTIDLAATGVSYQAGRQNDRASNGAVRGRVLFPAAKRIFTIEHRALTLTKLTTFRNFYSANSALTFTLYWPADGVTYTVMFAESEPKETPINGVLTTVELELWEV